MAVLYVGFVGLLAFVAGVAVLGLWLRRHPSQGNAERASRIMHFLFFAGLVTPALIIIFYPGLTHLDELVGLRPLPLKPVFLVAGIVLAIAGFYLLGVSNKLLRDLGEDYAAYRREVPRFFPLPGLHRRH